MCKPFQQNQGQPARPGAVVRSNLSILDGLVLLNERDYATQWDATQAIRTQTSRLESELSSATAEVERLKAELARANARAERHYGQLQKEQEAHGVTQTVARNVAVMVRIVRDLTKVFPDAELDFQQTDEQGYEYRVTGYAALDLEVDFYNYKVKVRNVNRARRAKSYGLDGNGDLSDDAFEGIESLFRKVELTRDNTPSRVHDVMFEEPSSDMFGPNCGNQNCPLHGANGLAAFFSGLVGSGVQVLDLSVFGDPFI